MELREILSGSVDVNSFYQWLQTAKMSFSTRNPEQGRFHSLDDQHISFLILNAKKHGGMLSFQCSKYEMTLQAATTVLLDFASSAFSKES